MTNEEARMALLEDALVEAHHMIEFLHGCLTDDSYKYDYPQQTLALLDSIARLVDIEVGCHHSRMREDCVRCRKAHEHRQRVAAARRAIT